MVPGRRNRETHPMKTSLLQTLRTTAAAVLVALPMVAHAAQPFEDKAFEAAQDAGKAIVVDVSAPWCPTCAKQKPILERLEAGEPKVVVFDVDFDSRKDVLKRFGVQHQSTLIAFKGKTEVGRSTGDTNADSIGALFRKGL